ncbi:MAG TPA: alanine racemase [Xanthomonadales bacterium]|nr:alanine racemase [Xanthomonadales bacterium]
MARPTHAIIHLDALRHNLARIRQLAPGAKVMAVVKADGYGHGLERVAMALQGADAFGVAALADAERLRAAGHSQRIVLLSGFDSPEDLPDLRRLDVEVVLHHESQLRILESARAQGEPAWLGCWVKLDTGMHRLGFAPESAPMLMQRLARIASVRTEPVWMTHFARSDEFDCAATGEQIARFSKALDGLAGSRSLANSAGVLGWPASHGDWVRPGGALYGISVVAGRTGADFGLRPAMSLGTRLIAINSVAAGEAIGYGGDFRTPGPMRIGVAAIGYGDGYPRAAPSGTPVQVGGRPARLVGRVSMDLLAIDLTNLPEARVGDPVLLWGPELPVERVAAAAATIGYELVCSITRRVRFLEA